MFDQGQRSGARRSCRGLHGRWEWMQPALDRSSPRSCRTISYSLCGDIGVRRTAGPRRRDSTTTCVSSMRCSTDRACATRRAVRRLVWRLRRAALCGDAAGPGRRRSCSRPRPAPGWKPNAQQARWLARPWLSAPAFVATRRCASGRKCGPPSRRWPSRLGFFVRQGLRAAGAPMIPSLMAERISLARQIGLRAGLRAHHGAHAGADRRRAARSRRAGGEHAVVLHAHSRRRVGRPRTHRSSRRL